MLEKLLLKKNYQKIIRKASSVAFLLKKFELSNPHTNNYTKTDSTANISLVCFENIKIVWRASVIESRFSKLTETSRFCNTVEKSSTCMVCSEK